MLHCCKQSLKVRGDNKITYLMNFESVARFCHSPGLRILKKIILCEFFLSPFGLLLYSFVLLHFIACRIEVR